MIGYVYSEEALAFEPPAPTVMVGNTAIQLGPMNVSNPTLTRIAHEVISASGLLDSSVLQITPGPIAESALLAVHDPAYVREVEAASQGDPWEFAFCEVAAQTWWAASLAAGGAVAAVDSVMAGEVDMALAQIRPPGHHAERARAMGSCYFNNVACAAERALALGAERVLVLDWDVHIGNGAEQIFWDRDDVLTISIHQEGWYPDHGGFLAGVGGSGAEGANVNVPLPPGVNDAGYLEVLKGVVEPVVRAFRPDLIVVAAGQDPAILDPLGRMMVSADGFAAMTESICELARDVCDGALVICTEGGYLHMYTPFCVAAVFAGLRGKRPELIDPLADDAEVRWSQGPCAATVGDAIAAVRATQTRWF